MSNWKPTSGPEVPDKHPVEGCFKRVLLYCPDLDEKDEHDDGVRMGYYIHQTESWRMEHHSDGFNITHWQPIPNPPRSKK